MSQVSDQVVQDNTIPLINEERERDLRLFNFRFTMEEHSSMYNKAKLIIGICGCITLLIVDLVLTSIFMSKHLNYWYCPLVFVFCLIFWKTIENFVDFFFIQMFWWDTTGPDSTRREVKAFCFPKGFCSKLVLFLVYILFINIFTFVFFVINFVFNLLQKIIMLGPVSSDRYIVYNKTTNSCVVETPHHLSSLTFTEMLIYLSMALIVFILTPCFFYFFYNRVLFPLLGNDLKKYPGWSKWFVYIIIGNYTAIIVSIIVEMCLLGYDMAIGADTWWSPFAQSFILLVLLANDNFFFKKIYVDELKKNGKPTKGFIFSNLSQIILFYSVVLFVITLQVSQKLIEDNTPLSNYVPLPGTNICTIRTETFHILLMIEIIVDSVFVFLLFVIFAYVCISGLKNCIKKRGQWNIIN